METQICKNCTHFRQHYIIDDQTYTAIHCGHCTCKRAKSRKPTTKACEAFEERTQPPLRPDRRSVVHFLNTQMLEYIMELPLPPEEK